MTATPETNQLHARIRGDVQGVDFRASAKQVAQRLNLAGWIRNNPDGTVEVVAEGSRSQLQEFADFLEDGPPAAHVQSVDFDWKPATGNFDGFQVS